MKIKKMLPLLLLMVIMLVGCGNSTEDVTAKYFSSDEFDSYDLSPGYLGEEFNFDSGEFAFSVINKDNKKREVYLPMSVNKVGAFGDYDIIQFDFKIEDSNVPDYDWTQHFTRTNISRKETFTKKIINNHETYIIKQVGDVNSSEQDYLLLPHEGIDEEKLNNLLRAETADEFREMETDIEYFFIYSK